MMTIKQELEFEECLKQRLKFICEFSKVTPCKFKGYEIIDYYQDSGISAKTGNHRSEFERFKNDIKAKKINTIIALKLDRITRSIYDWENLMTFLDENDAYLDCVNDEINRFIL